MLLLLVSRGRSLPHEFPSVGLILLHIVEVPTDVYFLLIRVNYRKLELGSVLIQEVELANVFESEIR